MAYALNRFFRAFRSVAAPLTTFVGFSFLLTWIFILYQPTPGPGIIQRLGWQSWDVVSLKPPTASSSTISSPSPSTSAQSGSDTVANVPEGTDWWNVSSTEPSIDSSGLPLDVWAPLLPHDTGFSEIAVVHCLVSPKIAPAFCAPPSSSEQDAIKGKWVRVDRNLNLEGGYTSGWLHMYYRRTRRQDINLIDEIRLLPDKEDPFPKDGWTKVSTSLRSGIYRAPPLYMWYHAGKTAAQLSAAEKANLFTELDVLYGEDEPWYGFEKLEPATLEAVPGRVAGTWVTYRRGVKPPPRAPPLHFDRQGNFKILQIADLHFSVSQGTCKDTPEPCSNGDVLTSSLLEKMLDAEKPDLVVFTGDQLNGQGTSWDPKSILAKFSRLMTARKIPWAAVFGNHDSEIGAPRDEQLQLMMALPYSLVERGPKDVHGVGNYVLKVKSADASMTHLLTLYFLDSGSYAKGYWNLWGVFKPTAYDWLRQSQIDWFLRESGSIKPIERPFKPDTGKDLGKIWSERQEQVTPQTGKLAKPNAMMFFHIPLPESYTTPDTDSRTGKLLDVGEHGLEEPGNAEDSDGFFDKALLVATESEHRSQQFLPEVKVVGNGHCHVTENCRRVKGVWLCFGGGGSFSGYGKIGFDRRFRIYDISDYGETIRTYKRTEKNEILDDMVLSGRGAPS